MPAWNWSRRHLPPWGVWAAAWALMLALDRSLDLANLALLLVLAAVLAALWWPPSRSVPACAAAVLAFNYAFVPPRHTFRVDLHHDALLLTTLLAVSWIVALLMARQRRQAADAREQARRAEQLRALAEALRAGDPPQEAAARLQQALSQLAGAEATLWLAPQGHGAVDGGHVLGPSDAALLASLQRCAALGRPQGAGTGEEDDRPDWLLPLRGRDGAYGAARLAVPADEADAHAAHAHAQALCDQLGAGLERATALQAAAAARESAQAEALRNTLLAAIAHDHRTPLATILGAAGSLHDQGDRLSAPQRLRLAATIVDEASQLARLADNTLQLARLESGAPTLQRDWESVEEIVGTVLRHARRRGSTPRLRARVRRGLPLLRCDALLLVQLLDNLVDNALRYGAGGPVHILACRGRDGVLVAVRDRGPGVPAAERERIFRTFQRGAAAAAGDAQRRGAGVGLAVCRAIAAAHGGTLAVQPRARGGASFELRLPLAAAPVATVAAAVGGA